MDDAEEVGRGSVLQLADDGSVDYIMHVRRKWKQKYGKSNANGRQRRCNMDLGSNMAHVLSA